MSTTAPAGSTPPRSSRSTYPAFAARNFRLLWSGQAVSLTGTLMQDAAVLWHVSLLAPDDERALWLGLVGLARVVPIFVCALFAGVIADAYDRRKILVVTQTALAIFATVLAVLALSGHASLPAVLVLTALTAGAASFEGPARSAFVPSLVPREHIGNAVSLNATLYQLARVIGPALGGVMLGFVDVGVVYLLNALSFVAVLTALAKMRDLPVRAAKERASVSMSAITEGLHFAFSTPLLRATVLLDFIAAFFAAATTMLPLVAQDVLGVGSAGFGLLYAAPSIGAVAASAWMVRHEGSIQRKGNVLLWAIAAFGVATVAFGLSRSMVLTFVCLACVGAADTVNVVLRNVLRQLVTPDHLRGRMSAVNVFFAKGGPELGELEAGLVAQAFGVTASIVSGGIACIASTGWIAWRTPALREYGDGVLVPVAPQRTRGPAPVPGGATTTPPARTPGLVPVAARALQPQAPPTRLAPARTAGGRT